MLWRPLVVFVFCAVVYGLIERLAPLVGRRRSWREARTDASWFFVDEVVKAAARALTLGLLVAIAWVLGWERTPDALVGFGPLSRQPGWLQAVQVILLADLLGYTVHRLTHAVPWLWRIHAVHHSPTHLDWLAGARVHPLDTVITRPLRTLPILLLGYDPTTALVATPFLAFWTLFVHADVRWHLGPLRWVVSTPPFHRRHHAAEGPPCNFAPLLPVWDLLFGTFRPPAEDALRTGVDDLDVPEDLVGQVRFPLGRRGVTARGASRDVVVERLARSAR